MSAGSGGRDCPATGAQRRPQRGETQDHQAPGGRFRDGGQINGVPVAGAVEAIAGWVARRENASPTAEALGAVLA